MLIDHFTYGDPLAELPDSVAALDAVGLDGWFVAEANRDPFLAATVAAEHSVHLTVGTGVALAFARNPLSVAYLAHDLQELSGGRFVLGLGTQIRAHIERRFGAEWGRPVARMREFVAAFRAIWDAWEQDTDLGFEGRYYRHTLMPPAFRPDGRQPRPPVYLAAVGPRMTGLAGAVADGILCHPFSGPRYLREATLPAVAAAADEAGRDAAEVTVSGSVLVVTGSTEEAVAASLHQTRERIAFYASTPAYRPVLEIHGWETLHDDARRLTREGRWGELPGLVDDEVLDAFAIQAPPEEVGREVAARYAGVLDRVNISTSHAFSPEQWQAIVADLRAAAIWGGGAGGA